MNPIFFVAGWRIALVWIFLLTVAPPALLKRMDRIIGFVESGQGSVGKLIYDPTLYNRVNTTVTEFQGLVSEISGGKGSLGKLLNDDELYNKANASIDKINKMIDDLNAGNGTAGKLKKVRRREI